MSDAVQLDHALATLRAATRAPAGSQSTADVWEAITELERYLYVDAGVLWRILAQASMTYRRHQGGRALDAVESCARKIAARAADVVAPQV